MLAITEIDVNADKARVQLFADAKEDLTSVAVAKIVGREVEMGSSCITADGEVAFLKSDGTWNWMGGE